MQERAAATDTCMDAAVAAVLTSRRNFCFGRTTRQPQHWKVSVVVLLCQPSAAEQSSQPTLNAAPHTDRKCLTFSNLAQMVTKNQIALSIHTQRKTIEYCWPFVKVSEKVLLKTGKCKSQVSNESVNEKMTNC